MTKDDIDLFEINEAFSAVVLRYMQALDLDPAKVNVNGGAIAMGHPLGATGAMILGTVLDELERTGQADGPGHALRRRRHGHGDDHRAGLNFMSSRGREAESGIVRRRNSDNDPGSSLRCGRDDGAPPGGHDDELHQFPLRDRRRRHRARDLGHARPLHERHHPRGDGGAGADRRDGRGRRGHQGLRHHLRQGGVLGRRRPHHAPGPRRANMRGSRRRRARRRPCSFFFEESRKLSLLYRRLETCGKPFAAAVHGVCLGGAFELALACHFRVLSDADSTRVGLPEIKVGLFPGAGGTQRVARLMQTGDALQMLFKGEQIRPLMARNMGLVHAVAPRDEIVQAAKDWIKQRRLGRRALGPEGLQAAVQQGLFRGRHADLAAGQRHLPPRDAGQLPGRLRDPGIGLSGPAAADGSGAQGGVALVRQDPALEGSGGDDPHALHLHAGSEQGRAPAQGRAADEPQEGRRRRRGLHGRERRLRDRQCGPRGRAHRPRRGSGREGQGAFAQAHVRPDHEGPRQDGGPRRAARAHHAHRPITAISRIAISSSRPCSRIRR